MTIEDLDTDGSWLAEYRAKADARAAKTAHRKVPMPPVPRGHCRWCARPIVGVKGKYIGRPNPLRSWCRPTDPGGRDCWFEFLLHSSAETQFGYLARSRGLACADCGAEDPQRWRSLGLCTFPDRNDVMPWDGPRNSAAYWEALTIYRKANPYPQGTLIERVTALEVDHVVPLWRVALMPIELRRPYFGPDFLQLLCNWCHKAKTKAEAAHRAQIKALARRAALPA